MDTIVMKFGGSSVADNDKLKIVANKVIDIKKDHNVVVILSAQGKTTDKLINEAKELSKNAKNREMDMLISTGEQIAISKLGILLNEMGYDAISLTGWQAGIHTNNTNLNAKILNIDTTRIISELEKGRIVIIAGFQGIDENQDITTLGRGGSDTTAVAISAALNAKKCYIYSDVDGVYTADPKVVKNAKKLMNISYKEMEEVANEGAKVLNNRSVEVGEKFNIPIIAKSTFNDKKGTVVSNDNLIEDDDIKSIVKKDVSRISIISNGIIRNKKLVNKIINIIENSNYEILEFNITQSKVSIILKSIIDDDFLNEIHKQLVEK